MQVILSVVFASFIPIKYIHICIYINLVKILSEPRDCHTA